MRNEPGRYYRVLKQIDYGVVLSEKQLNTGYIGKRCHKMCERERLNKFARLLVLPVALSLCLGFIFLKITVIFMAGDCKVILKL